MRIAFICISLLVLLLVTAPYLAAARLSGPDAVFGGFLLNPTDGNSYLAKMYEGWRGDARFTLPYTANPGKGAYLFLFYLFLGRAASLLGLPLLIVFHVARGFGAAVLLLSLFNFLKVSGIQARWLGLSFTLAALGSGMGWLAFPFGYVASDLLVPEAYPFLSAFATPHFALGLALLLWLLALRFKEREASSLKPSGDSPGMANTLSRLLFADRDWWLAALAALVLGISDPFAVVIALVVLAGLLVWELALAWRWRRNAPQSGLRRLLLQGAPAYIFSRLFWAGIGGAPFVLYDFWAARVDPVLAGWNAQNLTPSPPLWDVLLSLSPALLVALVGGWLVVQRSSEEDKSTLTARLALVWLVLGFLLIYLPLGLQRRFLTGLYAPVVVLAGYGFEALAMRFGKRVSTIAGGVLLLSVLTNTLFMLVLQQGIRVHDPLIYLTRGEAEALDWIKNNTAQGALILAAPESGLYIPAYTGRRVLYGHPFETVDAAWQKAAVEGFYSGTEIEGVSPRQLLNQNKVDYILYGPRERKLGGLPASLDLLLAYSKDGVELYQAAGSKQPVSVPGSPGGGTLQRGE